MSSSGGRSSTRLRSAQPAKRKRGAATAEAYAAAAAASSHPAAAAASRDTSGAATATAAAAESEQPQKKKGRVTNNSRKAAAAAIPAGAASSSVPAQSRRCAFSRLASVEAQCIMQCLDAKSILALARASTRMRSDADHAAAWRFATLEVAFPGSLLTPADFSGFAAHLTSSFRHGVQLSVHWHAVTRTRYDFTPIDDAEIAGLLSLPRITGLEITRQNVSKAAWTRLATSSRLAELRSACFERKRLPQGWSQMLSASAPLLRSLTLTAGDATFEPQHFAHLDTVSVTDPWSHLPLRSVWLDLAQCTGLTDVSVLKSTLSGANFVSVLTNPNLSRLRRLQLTIPAHFSLFDNAAQAEAVLQSMASLTHLTVPLWAGEKPLMAALQSAPSLQLLTLAYHAAGNWGPVPLPDCDSLAAALAACPQLRVEVEMGELQASWPDRDWELRELAESQPRFKFV